MFKERKPNYKFYVDEKNRKVIAVSTYAGRYVKGVAVAHPGDTFDLELGKKIAAARCNMKVAKKRLARANQKLLKIDLEMQKLEAERRKTAIYQADAYKAALDAEYDLCDVLDPLK